MPNPGAGAGGLGRSTTGLPTGAPAGYEGPAPNMQDLYAAMAAFMPMLTQGQGGMGAPQPAVVGGANPAQVLMGQPPPGGGVPMGPQMPQMPSYLMGPQR